MHAILLVLLACDGWTPVVGEVAEDAGCAVVQTTDAAATAYAFARADRVAETTLPMRASLRWRRVDGENKSIEMRVAGAVVLVGDGKVGVWVSDARFADVGWQPARAAVRVDSALEVVQTADAIDIAIDGAPAMHYPFAAPLSAFHVGVGFKAARGARGRLRFYDVRVSSLAR